MSENNWSQNLKFSWKNILIWGLAVALAALILSLIQPFEYRASMRFTVSQRQFGFNQDAYAAAKSSEKLARNIADTINSRAFLEDIFNSGFGIERSTFSSDEAKMRKTWEEKVNAKTQTETGMLFIEVYDTDKAKALKISEAITYVLNTKGADYHGGSRDVSIKRIDDPLVSKWPARPNLPINVIGGLALGVFSALAFYFLRGAPSAPTNLSEVKSEGQNFSAVSHGLPVENSVNNLNLINYKIPEPLEFIAPPQKAEVDESIKKDLPENLVAILPTEEPLKNSDIANRNDSQIPTPSPVFSEERYTWKPIENPKIKQTQIELPKNWLFED